MKGVYPPLPSQVLYGHLGMIFCIFFNNLFSTKYSSLLMMINRKLSWEDYKVGLISTWGN